MSVVVAAGAALVLIVGIALLEAFIKRPEVVAMSIFGAMLVVAMLGDPRGFPILGLPLSVTDGIYILVLLAAIARLLRIRGFTWPDRLLVLIGLLLLFSLAQGVVDYGDKATREFRPFVQFFAPAMYFSTVVPTEQMFERIGRVWLWGVGILVGLAAVRWIGLLTGIDLGAFEATHVSANFALRVLDGRESFTVAQTAIMLLPVAAYHPNSRVVRALAIGFGLTTILLNRRTAWVAAIIGLVLLMVRSAYLRRVLARPLIIIAIIAGVAFLMLPQSTESGATVASSPLDTGTFVGRVEGWQYLLAEGPEGVDWLIGTPLGPGFNRPQGAAGREVDTIPHNFYMFIVLRAGILGLAMFIGLYVLVLQRLRRWPSGGMLFAPSTLFVALIMQLVFFTTWIAPLEQGIILGLGCAFLRVRPVAERPATTLTRDAVKPHGRPARAVTGIPGDITDAS